MGRESSGPTSSSSDPEEAARDPDEGEDDSPNHTGRTNATADGEGVDTNGEGEGTNLDDQLRESILEGRFLFDPEEQQRWGNTTVWKWSSTWRACRGKLLHTSGNRDRTVLTGDPLSEASYMSFRWQ